MSTINYDSIWKLISKNKFEFQSDDDVTCGICKDLLVDACQSHCGCQFCYECIKDFIDSNIKLCPGSKDDCKEEPLVMEKTVHRNARLNKKIATLKVKCPNHSCDNVVQLNEMENHLGLCTKRPMECPYVPLGCTCEPSNKDDVTIHLHDDVIDHSELLIELIENMKNGISDNKSKWETITERNELLERKVGEQRMEIERLTIMVDEIKEKTESSIAEISSLRNEMEVKINEATTNIKIHAEEQRGGIGNLAATMDDLRKESESEGKSLKEESLKKENRLLCLEEGLTQVKKDFERMEKKIEDNVGAIVNEVKNISKMVKERSICDIARDRRLNNLIKLCPNIDSDFLWRIDDCSKKLNQFLFSEPFYSNNYKLCLRLLIDMDDNIWLYCHIMSGEYDDKVKFPMRRRVTLTIIDQHTLGTHQTQTYTYETIEHKEAFDRPTSQRNYFGIGSSSFIGYLSIKDRASVVVADSFIVSCVTSDP